MAGLNKTAVWFQKRSNIAVMVPSSPKKGLSYEKCFVRPMIDCKLKPNFGAINAFGWGHRLQKSIVTVDME